MSGAIRDLEPADLEPVLRLNAAVERWTSPLTLDRLRVLVELAAYRRVIGDGGRVDGFLLAMRDGCGYENDNLHWFEARERDFAYVDRIVVAADRGGRGLGRRLYDDLFAWSRERGLRAVVCEYVVEPLNEASRRFHAGTGFVEVGRRVVPGKTLSMQRRGLRSS